MASAESRQSARFAKLSRIGRCLPAAVWARAWCWGLVWRLWLELRDKSIRTEADAEAALELPMLVAVPWVVGAAEVGNGNGKGRFWKRKTRSREETARV